MGTVGMQTVEFRVFECKPCDIIIRVREDAYIKTPGSATQDPKCSIHGKMARIDNETLNIPIQKPLTAKKLKEMLDAAKDLFRGSKKMSQV